MEQRNRGIDLLRMTAMWMVVILHILNKGGVLAAAAPLSAGQGTARLLETAAYCAVNCYGLISGYVGVQRRFRYSGALALWLRVAFYTLGITAVFACLMPGSVNGDRVLRAFFPVLFRQYWYVTAYFGMCLFIPFFNLLLNRLSKGQLRLLALSIALDRAIDRTPRVCFRSFCTPLAANSPLMQYPGPPMPVPSGQPPWIIKPGMTRWKISPS